MYNRINAFIDGRKFLYNYNHIIFIIINLCCVNKYKPKLILREKI